MLARRGAPASLEIRRRAAHIGAVHDPRSPELLAWIDGLPTAWQMAVALRALCFAYPFLKICKDWQEKIAVIEDAMHLLPGECEAIIMEAAKVGARLKRERAA
jgi:hypothetical protein